MGSDAMQALDSDTVHAVLSANFPFRTSPDAHGTRAYRFSANGPALLAMSTSAGVHLHAPKALPGLVDPHRSGPTGHGGLACTLDGLLVAIEAFQGHEAVLPTSMQRSTSATPMPIAATTTDVSTNAATNTILYGPPGTGKTYATASRAVQLCDGSLPAEGTREAVLARYEVLRQEGRITFVTFHQSYGYEEFVEGLRPRMGEGGEVVYDVVPGAFRRACDAARPRVAAPQASLADQPMRQRGIFKMSLGVTGSAEGSRVYRYALENDRVLLGWGSDVDFSDCHSQSAIRERLLAEAPGTKKPDSHAWYVDQFKNVMKEGDLIVVSQGNKAFKAIAEVTGKYEYVEDAPFQQSRAVRWLAVFEHPRPVAEINKKEFNMWAFYRIKPELLHFDALESLLAPPEGEGQVLPHVLIIDEINRANVSKVFGELITLIEPDKREGAAEALTLTLPYSSDDFSVPSNLHILGTMNTADRSIALLDTALRRRFDFEELQPDPSVLKGCVVEGIELERLLAALNERIEALYDRDHTIGHAFLIGVRDVVALERVFRRKLLPLLQEYFHESWSQVRRVLRDVGEGDFIERRVLPGVPPDGEDGFEDEPQVSYRVRSTPFPVPAYRRIYESA